MNRADGQNPDTASSASATTAAALCELARQHLEAGKTLDAQLCCQQALDADSRAADAMHVMGLIALRAEQADHAIEWFIRAIRHDPSPLYLLSLGHALKRQGRLDDALKTFNKAVELDLGSREGWKALAQLLSDLQRHDEAVLAFQHVLRLDPGDADAAAQAGLLLFRAGRPEEALAFLDRSSGLRPDHAPALQIRALALQALARDDEAFASLASAHALDPGNAEICNNIGVIQRRAGRRTEALSWFDKAVALRPDFWAARSNKAYVLVRLHRFDEALAIYAELKAADPTRAEPVWDAALLQLLTGNFEAGWSGREARLSIANFTFTQPMWRGEEIAGKTILIQQDEGLGDAILFARYVPMVAALGARIILHVNEPLVVLLSKLPGVVQCISRSATCQVSFDTFCTLGSLPFVFGTRLDTIPAHVPYLPAPETSRVEAWERRLGRHERLRVGLVWSGNPTHHDDQQRSIALRALSPLLDLDATFVSLQKDPRLEDGAFLRERSGIVDLTAHLTDFAETAALVSCLDLVISVDTSTAHLAGALARPTWILLPYTPDWRWLLDRDDSPWYPTVRLFRQSEARDYVSVIERVRGELVARIAAWSAPVADRAEADFRAGVALFRSGKPEDALVRLDQSNRLRPDHAPTLQMRAIVLFGLSRFEDAIADMGRAHVLAPDDADICNNMGVLLRRRGRADEALGWFDKALKRRPDFAAASSNKATALGNLHRFEEALAIYRALAAADPGNAEAEFNAGFLQLLLGDFEAGWIAREARWRMPGQDPVNVSQPIWLGKEPVAGKTILLHQDEGLGDVIQFARYVPLLAERGARVILRVADGLVALLDKLPGVVDCVPKSTDRQVSFDMYCPITTLPLAFGTRLETIPSATPYLPAPDPARVQAWEDRLGPHDRFRVGLVWSGNPRQSNDPSRSTTLATLLPLLDLDATFVSLQKDPRPADRATLRERSDIVDLTAHLTDFVETAALMSCCDLIVTVCTSPAHLAGALARPTWVMLCYEADYRWLLDRDDSPWYPTLRLFRQDATRSYADVVKRIRPELSAKIAAWSERRNRG